MFGPIFGLISMFSWGISDFIAAKTLKSANVERLFFWSQIIGMIIVAPFIKWIDFSVLLIVLGAINFVGMGCLYKALSSGKATIVSPIIGTAPAFTAVLAFFILNETLANNKVLGIALAVIGIMLSSFKIHDLVRLNFRSAAKGVNYAFTTVLFFGTYPIVVSYLNQNITWFQTLIWSKIFTLFFISAFMLMKKTSFRISKQKKTVLFVGLFDIIATCSFYYGITLTKASIISVFAGAAPIVVIILARLNLKEKIELNQGIGIGCAIMGVILVSI